LGADQSVRSVEEHGLRFLRKAVILTPYRGVWLSHAMPFTGSVSGYFSFQQAPLTEIAPPENVSNRAAIFSRGVIAALREINRMTRTTKPSAQAAAGTAAQ